MRQTLLQLLMILMLTIQLTSCITTRETNYLQQPKNFIPAYKDSIQYLDYQLKIGDKVTIQVYSKDQETNQLFNGSGNLSSQLMSASNSEGSDLYSYTIDSNGNIKLPLIGDVYVLGKTLRETKVILESAIKPILTVNSVDVRMMGRFFSIVGSGKSGRFAFSRDKINIFQALAMVGDFGFYTDRSKIRILRETTNGTVIKSFDVRSKDIIHSEFYYLEPNDVIFLQPLKQQFFSVTTFWTAISTLVTTYSFATIIYKSIPKPVSDSQ